MARAPRTSIAPSRGANTRPPNALRPPLRSGDVYRFKILHAKPLRQHFIILRPPSGLGAVVSGWLSGIRVSR